MDDSFAALREATEQVLRAIGEDPGREGLARTPERVAHSLQFLTQGYRQDPAEVLRAAMFREDYSQMVVVKDIEFYSLCEHHMLPFFGHVHVGYVPDGRIVGLSKIPRVVDIFARRLQVQERLTVQLRRCIEETLQPKGVIVVVEARHLCMQMRGVEKRDSITRTVDYGGCFAQDDRRAEFLRAVGMAD